MERDTLFDLGGIHMVDQLLGGQSDFAVFIFVLAAFVFLGFALLVSRIGEARSRRRLKIGAVAGGPAGSFDPLPAAAASVVAPVENQLRDANHALFKVLMECCQMIAPGGDGAPLTNSAAATYATELWESRRTAMSNREIADHGYQLAAHLQSFDDPRIVAIRRVLTQLALAEQWTTNWHGGEPGGENARTR
jgi:hypothetical protein